MSMTMEEQIKYLLRRDIFIPVMEDTTQSNFSKEDTPSYDCRVVQVNVREVIKHLRSQLNLASIVEKDLRAELRDFITASDDFVSWTDRKKQDCMDALEKAFGGYWPIYCIEPQDETTRTNKP